MATPPATVARKNGVATDENANSAPNSRCRANVVLALRNANPAPRPMMPSAATVSGMYIVDVIAANTGGNPVHSSTITKISQTWLASQTGPIECSISLRCGQPLRAPPATRSQNPPPKSAPPSSA